MEFILSGYGQLPTNNLALCSLSENNSFHIKWQTSIEDPSFICGGDGYLFTITEAMDYAYLYLYRSMGDGYELLDKKRIQGGCLCHIMYSPKNQALFGACYGTGTIFSVQVEQNRFGEILHHEIQHGDDPQALTRAHGVFLNQAETKLITVNIALDRIYYYNINHGRLTLDYILEVPEGTGPRHLVFSADETLLYVITEYSNEILIYENTSTRRLLQRISTLSEGYSGVSNCSTLCFSSDRNYLYAANRGAQTIALFRVLPTGLLSMIKEFDCKGRHPRHMLVSQNGKYLLIANQLSDHLTVFELDAETGEIMDHITDVPFPAPSGIMEVC